MLPFKTKAIYSHSGDKSLGFIGFMEDDVIQVTQIYDENTFIGISLRTRLQGKILKDHLLIPPHVNLKHHHSSSSTLNTDFTQMSNYGGSHTNTDSTHTTPPPTPKHEEKFKSSYVQQLLASSITETEKSNSLFGHSDFSATSAGSFMRHKEFKQSNIDLIDSTGNPLRDRLNSALLDVELNRNKRSGFLQRIMGKSLDRELSFDESMIISMERHTLDDSTVGDDSMMTMGSGTIVNSGMNGREDVEFNLVRSASINGRERSKRSKRLSEYQPDIVLKPHEFITEFNKNETIPNYPKRKPNEIDEEQVDKIIRYFLNNNMTLDAICSILLKKLSNELERHKALYTYLTHFKIQESILEKVSLKRMPNFDKLSEILINRQCSNHQLVWIYYIISNKLGFDVELVLGYYKHPFQFDESLTDSRTKLSINHSWISLQFNGALYFTDPILGNSNHVDDYILMKPFEVVSTHIPMHIDQQHITPPIDPIVQLNMPPNYPKFNNLGVKFINFNTSLFHLRDFELFDFKMKIPQGVEVNAYFQAFDKDMYPTTIPLVQMFFNEKNEKIANIKGILPQFCPSGTLNIEGKLQDDDKFEILTSIPVFHIGKWKQIKWVKVDNSNVDRFGSCYIKTPKIYKLPLGYEQRFRFKLSNFTPNKLVMVSPRNKKHSFQIVSASVNESLDMDEAGIWKLCIPDHERNVLKVIAQWKVK